MKQIGGVWLPDGETHLVQWMQQRNEVVDGKLSYQFHKLQAALQWVTQWRVALDVGAHCGLLSMHLAKRFEHVHAFEPVAAHRECFRKNVMPDDWEVNDRNAHDEKTNHRVYLDPIALGEHEASVAIHTSPGSSGDSWVSGAGDIPMKRLDDLFYSREPWLDFIKLDCEGYELFALRGGEETLKRCRPCVMVEQKPGRAQKFGLLETGAVDYLQSLGAVLRKQMSGDFILSWPDPIHAASNR